MASPWMDWVRQGETERSHRVHEWAAQHADDLEKIEAIVERELNKTLPIARPWFAARCGWLA